MYKIGWIGIVSVERVETGILKLGMFVIFHLLNSIKKFNWDASTLEEAIPGDIVRFNVKNVSVKELKRGFICPDSQNHPICEASNFIA